MTVQLIAAVRRLGRWAASALAAWGGASAPWSAPVTPLGDPLRCRACRRPYACPVAWEPEGEDHWWIELRCGDCGHRRDVVLSNAETAHLEELLAVDERSITRAAERLDAERMALEADAFGLALACDLIVPDDFGSRLA